MADTRKIVITETLLGNIKKFSEDLYSHLGLDPKNRGEDREDITPEMQAHQACYYRLQPRILELRLGRIADKSKITKNSALHFEISNDAARLSLFSRKNSEDRSDRDLAYIKDYAREVYEDIELVCSLDDITDSMRQTGKAIMDELKPLVPMSRLGSAK